MNFILNNNIEYKFAISITSLLFVITNIVIVTNQLHTYSIGPTVFPVNVFVLIDAQSCAPVRPAHIPRSSNLKYFSISCIYKR